MNNTSMANIAEETLKNIEYALDTTTIMIIADAKGNVEHVNDKFYEVTGYTREDIIASPALVKITAENSGNLSKSISQTLQSGKVWKGEIKNRKKNGQVYWVDTTVVPFLNKEGAAYQHIVLQHEITQRKEYELAIKEMAYSDPLTKLQNRNQIKKWALEHTAVTEEITVFFIDLDRFKNINDNFGHDIGDQVLVTASNRLKEGIEAHGSVFKYGGEEFIIIFEDKTQEEIEYFAESILKMMRKPIKIDNVELLITASIGISSARPGTIQDDFYTQLEELIKKADTAMYLVKKQGGNQYHLSTVRQRLEIERSYKIELEIRNALELNEYSMVYQPLINLKTNKIVGVESLLRWNNRLLGSISPAEFIPVLESTGLIIPVGQWILKTVCRQMKDWQEEGLFLQRITVNVSPVQFRDSSFVGNLQEILNQTELDASYLEIEITEGTLVDIKDSANKLQALQELGVKVSIDDFGTGYSSLSYLKKLPIDTLKIDKSFISDLDHDGEIIVNTIINMGKNLQFRVIAEGIENADQFKYLQQQECHEGQGYFFSKPVKGNMIEEIYHSLQ